ncbi:adenosylcobinamide amidohydrolase [Halorubrum cibi]|uniref:Adenosylcobinamide hydrolase n=1 Tax=Halorubrum cibi TaxID=413815 RepID=A0A521D995_9EURY|nr:adenosylcobinamide amidohydrolase [Halorubrum cibi]SMO68248.1 adenosylcobinamide hydrolase [Halorubrum cibi]
MSPRSPAFRADVADGVCRFRRVDGATRFLSTGFDGGIRVADAVHNVTVPEGWDDAGRRDLSEYVDGRVRDAGFADRATDGLTDRDAPALLTGVDQRHARIARLDGATAVATAGVSNPAALPISDGDVDSVAEDDVAPTTGTVNLLVGSERALSPGALANLVAVVAEAKAATLLATVGFPGTTSDAVVVGCPAERADATGSGSTRARADTDGPEPAAFSGSATPIGSAVRACVRDAVCASLASRYGADFEEAPASISDAEYGVVTDERAAVEPVDRQT